MTLEEGKLGVRLDLMVELLVQVYNIEKAEGKVGFFWVPAHVKVEKTEVADGGIKMALNREVDVNMVVGVQECRALIRSRITAEWQEQWENKRRGSITLVFRTVLMRSVKVLKIGGGE